MLSLAITEEQLPSRLRTVTVSPHTIDPAWRHCWNRMCVDDAKFAKPFFTADFAAAVSRVRPSVRVCVFLYRDEPVAFFPYQFASWRHSSVGWADPVGAHMSDYFGIVAAPGVTFTAGGLLRAAGLSYLYFGQLDGAQASLGLEGEHPVKGLLIHFEGGAGEYWEEITARDKSFANDTRRSARQIEERIGPLSLRTGPECLSADLDRVIEEKRAQYARTNVTDALAEPWTRDLLHELLKSGSSGCAPLLTVMYAGEVWAAAHFGIRFEKSLHYWFPVYNQELRRYSPGRLLLKMLIDQGCPLGLDTIDCGLGDAASKASLATGTHTLYRGAWSAGQWTSFVARGIQSFGWRIASLGRRS